MHKLELKIPPVVVFLLAAGLMWQLDRVSAAARFGGSDDWRGMCAAALLLIGVGIGVVGVYMFFRSSTTVNPHNVKNSSTLVTGGVYRRTRNPMYLGLLIVLVAYAVHLANPVALIALPLFVAYMNRFQIAPEERALEELFPDKFRNYREEVRRWL